MWSNIPNGCLEKNSAGQFGKSGIGGTYAHSSSKRVTQEFHKVLDTVSKEKKYLVWMEAPSLGLFKDFFTNSIVEEQPISSNSG